jgi:hypothetical protein
MKKIILTILFCFIALTANATNEIFPAALKTRLLTQYAAGNSQTTKVINDANTSATTPFYEDRGMRALTAYEMTGTASYCTTAMNILNTQIGDAATYAPASAPNDKNATRSIFLKASIIYSNCADVVSASLKSSVLSKMTYWSELVRGQHSGYNPSTSDSDAVVGHLMGAALFALAIRDEDITTSNAILSYMSVDYNPGAGDTYRNAIHSYCVPYAAGGEWLEGTNYNLETVVLLMVGADFINAYYGGGTDKFPEVTALYSSFADAAIKKFVSGFHDYFKYGDIQGDKISGINNYEAYGNAIIIASLANNPILRYIANNYLYFYQISNMDDWWPLYTDNVSTQTAPSGQNSLYASGQGVTYWHEGVGANDTHVMIVNKTNRWFTDHQFTYFANINIYKNGGIMLNNPKMYGGQYDASGYNNTVLINGMRLAYAEMRGPVAHKEGSNYAYQVGLFGGKTFDNFSASNQHVKEWTNYKFVRENADGTTTTIMYDRLNACDIASFSCAGYSSITNTPYDTDQKSDYTRVSGANIWQLHAENAITQNGKKFTWTAANGQTVTLETTIPTAAESPSTGFALSNLTPSSMPGAYPTGIPVVAPRYAVRFLMPQTNQWNTWLNFFYDGTQTVSKLTSSSGEAAIAGYYTTAGAENVLFVASAILPTYPAQTSGSSWDANRINTVGNLRLFTQGYTISVTNTGNVQAYFADLDPSKTWKYKIDGGSEQSLSVDSSTMGIATLSLSNGTHSIQIYNTGSSFTCSNTCTFCTDQTTCQASAAVCYWNGTGCTIPPAATCDAAHLTLCSTQAECQVATGHWCDDNNDNQFICQSTTCLQTNFGFFADNDCKVAYNFSEPSGSLLDKCSGDSVSDDGTVNNMGTRNGDTYVFNGSTSYVNIADSAENDFGASSYSVCEKIKMNSVTGNQTIYSKGYLLAGNKNYSAYLSGTSLVAENFDASNSAVNTWSSSMDTSTFKYICAVKNVAAGTLNIYENATLRSSQTDAVGDTQNALDLYLGAYCYASNSTFGASSVLDNFNRANEGPPLSSSWVAHSTSPQMKVASNVATHAAAGSYTDNWQVWNTTYGPDVEAYVTLSNKATDAYAWVWVRYDNTSFNGYGAAIYGANANRLRLFRLDGGVRTQLGADVTQTISSGDSIGIQVIGSTIKMFYKPVGGSWGEKLAASDSTYTGSGKMALQLQELNNAATLDDFGGGTLSTSTECPATTTPNRPSMEIDDFFILGRAMTVGEQQQWITAGGLTETPPQPATPTGRKVMRGMHSGKTTF